MHHPTAPLTSSCGNRFVPLMAQFDIRNFWERPAARHNGQHDELKPTLASFYPERGAGGFLGLLEAIDRADSEEGQPAPSADSILLHVPPRQI